MRYADARRVPASQMGTTIRGAGTAGSNPLGPINRPPCPLSVKRYSSRCAPAAPRGRVQDEVKSGALGRRRRAAALRPDPGAAPASPGRARRTHPPARRRRRRRRLDARPAWSTAAGSSRRTLRDDRRQAAELGGVGIPRPRGPGRLAAEHIVVHTATHHPRSHDVRCGSAADALSVVPGAPPGEPAAGVAVHRTRRRLESRFGRRGRCQRSTGRPRRDLFC